MSRETLNTQFWKACNILRQDDNTNSLLDYVEQISWLLFLKCFEEFEQKRRAEAEYAGKTWSPILAKKYQWSIWTDPARRLTGGDLISFLAYDLFPYLRNLQGNSARSVIRGVFADAPSKMLKDGAILRDAIDCIQEIGFETAEDVHTLSHLYESMLAKLGREGGMGGEFYTPRPIIEFIVALVNPALGETVYDPAMGSAGFLVEAHRHMRASLGRKILPKHDRQLQEETFYGQEKKPLPYLLGCMNMILHGVFSSNLARRNTLGDDVRKFTEKDRFHVILTNPPFGGTEHDSVKSNFPYPSKATSITFLQHIMKKVRRGGRVGMVIDETVLSKMSENAYLEARKELIHEFNVWAIVSLPAGVFANAVSSGTGPKTNLLFFKRELDKAGNPVGTKEIWYYDAQAVGFSLTKKQRPIPENDLPDCLEKARTRAVSERSWIVPVEEIVERNYDLSALNPNSKATIEHLSPAAIVADIAGTEQRLQEIITDISAALAPRSKGHVNQRQPKWATVKLGEFIRQRKDHIFLEDNEEYRRVTVRIHAKGIEPRDVIYGRDIKAKKQYPLKVNDLLVAEIDAKVGGYGIVPQELEGAVVSSHYYLYEVNRAIVDIRFLEYWLHTPSPLNQIQQFIRGALNYAAIRPYHFPEIEMSLPPISEQRRLLELINKVESARNLHAVTSQNWDRLKDAILSRAYNGEL